MSQGFDALQSYATRLRGAPLSDLLAREPERVAAHAVRSGPLYFNFARQSYDASAWQALVEHARQADLAAAFRRLFDGEKVNVTEDRAALHTALRGRHSDTAVAREAHESALQVRGRMADLVAQLEASDITDIVSVGIGGSDLGPRLVVDALAAPGVVSAGVHALVMGDGRPAAA